MGGRLDPLTFVVDAGEGVNGLHEGARGDIGDALGFVNDVAQGEAKIAVADGKEIEGVGDARVEKYGAAVLERMVFNPVPG